LNNWWTRHRYDKKPRAPATIQPPQTPATNPWSKAPLQQVTNTISTILPEQEEEPEVEQQQELAVARNNGCDRMGTTFSEPTMLTKLPGATTAQIHRRTDQHEHRSDTNESLLTTMTPRSSSFLTKSDRP